MSNYDKIEKERYISNYCHYYKQLRSKCNNDKQIKNITKELNNFLKYPDFRMVDEFVKHKDFVYF